MNFYGVSGLVRFFRRAIMIKDFKLKILSVIEKENLSLKEAAREGLFCGVQYSYWQRNYKKWYFRFRKQPRGRPKTMSNYKRKKRKQAKPLPGRKNCWRGFII